jgi:hypothetical protein
MTHFKHMPRHLRSYSLTLALAIFGLKPLPTGQVVVSPPFRPAELSVSELGPGDLAENVSLWSEPSDLAKRDLFLGPGGQSGTPDISSGLTVVKVAGRKSSNLIVQNDAGTSWAVASGPSAKAEISASRIIWAVGYHADQIHWFKEISVREAKLRQVQDAALMLRHKNYRILGTWSWTSNPFRDSRELEGLRTLMAVLHAFNLEDSKNRIVEDVNTRDRIYYVSDLRDTLGKAGNHSAGKAQDFSREPFIERTDNGVVFFRAKGKDAAVLKGVKVENARWIAGYLARLSDKQFADAFRAGGFSDDESAVYVSAMRHNIEELEKLGK